MRTHSALTSPGATAERIARPCLLVLCLLSSSCASLDPKPDIDLATSLVHTHSGWRPEWSAPWSGGSGADELWDGTTPLTEDLAVTLALRHNLAIRADLERIAASRADLVQAGLLPNPVLSLAFGFPVGGTTGPTEIVVGAMQQLAALWLRGPRVSAAEATLRQTILNVSDSALQLVADTRAAHARVVRGEALLLHRLRAAEARDRIASISRTLADVGEVSISDAYAAQIDAARQRQLLIETRRDLESARRQLLELIGRADAPADFPVPAPADNPDTPLLPESDAILAAARQRLDLAAALAARDAAGAALEEAGLGRLPELDVGVEFERDVEREKTLGPTFDIEIPIFDDGRAAQARAAADARRAHLEAEAVLQAVIREVRTAHVEFAAAAESARLAAEGWLAPAEGTFSSVRAMHDVGEASELELLLAEEAAALARADLVQRALDLDLARIRLERALGGRIPRQTSTAEHPGGTTPPSALPDAPPENP